MIYMGQSQKKEEVKARRRRKQRKRRPIIILNRIKTGRAIWKMVLKLLIKLHIHQLNNPTNYGHTLKECLQRYL